MNHVLMQYFEWYLPNDGKHWQRLAQDAKSLAELGIKFVWMPPAFKATSQDDVGYGIYDLYDLGEFDQKGTIRTKYGTKEEYLLAIQSLKEAGIRPIADIVLNHKAHGDGKERFMVVEVDSNNRQEIISEPFEIEAWTHFYFPGRNKKYSDFEWHWYHFTGTDYDALHDKTGIFMIKGDNKGWAMDGLVAQENGNYDYLMFTDIDFRHPEVREHLNQWIKWYIDQTGVEGFRLDAIKHIDAIFMRYFIKYIQEHMGEDFYVFGEYWESSLENKQSYLEQTNYRFDLVDVALHMNFFQASLQGAQYDFSTILNGTLMLESEEHAVTFVENHDTQRGQSLESTVEDWFKLHAYTIILLMKQGLPCIFYGDYYGVNHEQFGQTSFKESLDYLLYLRQNYAYGEQCEYFDHPDVIGWTRLGNEEHPDAMAVILSNASGGEKKMFVGEFHIGKEFINKLDDSSEVVIIDEQGYGVFFVNDRGISIYTPKEKV